MHKKQLLRLIPFFIFAICIVFAAAEHIKNADGAKVCYITFDDGPTLNTPEIVKTLEKYNARATFFVLRERIVLYPDYIKGILAAKNAVGLHGVSHSEAIYSTDTSPAEEMDKTNQALKALTGKESRLVRVPYGSSYRLTKAQYTELKNRGYLLWDWNVDPRDSVGKIYPENVMRNMRRDIKNAKTAPVILFHDRKSTLNLLDDVLSYLKENGYEMLPLSEKMPPENCMEEKQD